MDTTLMTDYIITVVDNASTDDTEEVIKQKFPQVRFISNSQNLGYAKAVNIGVKSYDTEFALVVNNDVIFHKELVDNLLKFISENKNIGVAGVRQFYPDGTIQYSYGDPPGALTGLKNLLFINSLRNFFAEHSKKKNNKIIEVGYVDGAALMIRREVFDVLNGFDEDYFFYTEEADFCYRLRKNNWSVVFNPSLAITHLRGSTTAHSFPNEQQIKMLVDSKFLFCRKHLSKIETIFYTICELENNSILYAITAVTSIFLKDEKLSKAKAKLDFHKYNIKYLLRSKNTKVPLG